MASVFIITRRDGDDYEINKVCNSKELAEEMLKQVVEEERQNDISRYRDKPWDSWGPEYRKKNIEYCESFDYGRYYDIEEYELQEKI